MGWKQVKIPHTKRKRKPLTEPRPLTELIAAVQPKYIIGIDEVGWGAIAGPFVAACTVYKVHVKNSKIRDSKTYSTEKAREKAFNLVLETAEYIGYQEASPGNIELYGAGPMLQQSFLILARRAISHYPESIVVIDGTNEIKGLNHPQISVAKADSLVTAVSAASIAAKVSRDHTMVKLGESFPEYKWCDNKGYGTEKHLKAMKEVGVSIHHRRNIGVVLDIEEKYGSYGEEK